MSPKFRCLIAALVILPAVEVFAKRPPPADVAPVFYEGVKYAVPPWGSYVGEKQNGGILQAFDSKTNQLLWEKLIYKITYDPKLEGDVQDIFIISLWVQGTELMVLNERGQEYTVNPRTHTVKLITNPPKTSELNRRKSEWSKSAIRDAIQTEIVAKEFPDWQSKADRNNLPVGVYLSVLSIDWSQEVTLKADGAFEEHFAGDGYRDGRPEWVDRKLSGTWSIDEGWITFHYKGVDRERSDRFLIGSWRSRPAFIFYRPDDNQCEFIATCFALEEKKSCQLSGEYRRSFGFDTNNENLGITVNLRSDGSFVSDVRVIRVALSPNRSSESSAKLRVGGSISITKFGFFQRMPAEY